MGSGYRVFTAGEVLSASNVQNYLQDQAVMVFGGTAARSSAIGTANFEEGMLTYLTDVDKLQVYTGAAFADVYPAAATNQGLTLISTTSFSGVASQSVNDVFSATYDNYLIVTNSETTISNAQILQMRLRVSAADNSSNNYYWSGYNIGTNGATPSLNTFGSNGLTSSFDAAVSNASTTGQTVSIINLFNPFATKRTSFESRMPYTDTSTGGFHRTYQGQMSVTTSYTGFTLISASGNVTGNVSVYGYNI